MKKRFWILALVFLVVPPVAADNETIFSKLVGTWQAAGNAFGAPSTSIMQWTDGKLGGKFLRLDYLINRTTPNGPAPIFSGVAYYQMPASSSPREQDVHAFWADTNGNLHPISATIEENALAANWGTPTTEQGRTRYEMTDQGTVEVTDWVKTPNGWQQFNHTIFTRADVPD